MHWLWWLIIQKVKLIHKCAANCRHKNQIKANVLQIISCRAFSPEFIRQYVTQTLKSNTDDIAGEALLGLLDDFQTENNKLLKAIPNYAAAYKNR